MKNVGFSWEKDPVEIKGSIMQFRLSKLVFRLKDKCG